MTGTGSGVARFDLAIPADLRFGAGRVSEVPHALVGLGASYVLVVTGRDSSRANHLRSALTEAGVSSVTFAVAARAIDRPGASRDGDAGRGWLHSVLGYGGAARWMSRRLPLRWPPPTPTRLNHLE